MRPTQRERGPIRAGCRIDAYLVRCGNRRQRSRSGHPSERAQELAAVHDPHRRYAAKPMSTSMPPTITNSAMAIILASIGQP